MTDFPGAPISALVNVDELNIQMPRAYNKGH